MNFMWRRGFLSGVYKDVSKLSEPRSMKAILGYTVLVCALYVFKFFLYAKSCMNMNNFVIEKISYDFEKSNLIRFDARIKNSKMPISCSVTEISVDVYLDNCDQKIVTLKMKDCFLAKECEIKYKDFIVLERENNFDFKKITSWSENKGGLIFDVSNVFKRKILFWNFKYKIQRKVPLKIFGDENFEPFDVKSIKVLQTKDCLILAPNFCVLTFPSFLEMRIPSFEFAVLANEIPIFKIKLRNSGIKSEKIINCSLIFDREYLENLKSFITSTIDGNGFTLGFGNFSYMNHHSHTLLYLENFLKAFKLKNQSKKEIFFTNNVPFTQLCVKSVNTESITGTLEIHSTFLDNFLDSKHIINKIEIPETFFDVDVGETNVGNLVAKNIKKPEYLHFEIILYPKDLNLFFNTFIMPEDSTLRIHSKQVSFIGEIISNVNFLWDFRTNIGLNKINFTEDFHDGNGMKPNLFQMKMECLNDDKRITEWEMNLLLPEILNNRERVKLKWCDLNLNFTVAEFNFDFFISSNEVIFIKDFRSKSEICRGNSPLNIHFKLENTVTYQGCTLMYSTKQFIKKYQNLKENKFKKNRIRNFFRSRRNNQHNDFDRDSSFEGIFINFLEHIKPKLCFYNTETENLSLINSYFDKILSEKHIKFFGIESIFCEEPNFNLEKIMKKAKFKFNDLESLTKASFLVTLLGKIEQFTDYNIKFEIIFKELNFLICDNSLEEKSNKPQTYDINNNILANQFNSLRITIPSLILSFNISDSKLNNLKFVDEKNENSFLTFFEIFLNEKDIFIPEKISFCAENNFNYFSNFLSKIIGCFEFIRPKSSQINFVKRNLDPITSFTEENMYVCLHVIYNSLDNVNPLHPSFGLTNKCVFKGTFFIVLPEDSITQRNKATQNEFGFKWPGFEFSVYDENEISDISKVIVSPGSIILRKEGDENKSVQKMRKFTISFEIYSKIYEGNNFILSFKKMDSSFEKFRTKISKNKIKTLTNLLLKGRDATFSSENEDLGFSKYFKELKEILINFLNDDTIDINLKNSICDTKIKVESAGDTNLDCVYKNMKVYNYFLRNQISKRLAVLLSKISLEKYSKNIIFNVHAELLKPLDLNLGFLQKKIKDGKLRIGVIQNIDYDSLQSSDEEFVTAREESGISNESFVTAREESGISNESFVTAREESSQDFVTIREESNKSFATSNEGSQSFVTAREGSQSFVTARDESQSFVTAREESQSFVTAREESQSFVTAREDNELSNESFVTAREELSSQTIIDDYETIRRTTDNETPRNSIFDRQSLSRNLNIGGSLITNKNSETDIFFTPNSQTDFEEGSSTDSENTPNRPPLNDSFTDEPNLLFSIFIYLHQENNSLKIKIPNENILDSSNELSYCQSKLLAACSTLLNICKSFNPTFSLDIKKRIRFTHFKNKNILFRIEHEGKTMVESVLNEWETYINHTKLTFKIDPYFFENIMNIQEFKIIIFENKNVIFEQNIEIDQLTKYRLLTFSLKYIFKFIKAYFPKLNRTSFFNGLEYLKNGTVNAFNYTFNKNNWENIKKIGNNVVNSTFYRNKLDYLKSVGNRFLSLFY
ncbi:hypothetical protein CWI37_0239p0040 [Hamiltosporidium tvaerminnensis]|uniref:Uncharacterized protein n=1 Tax=Hamiltosporidium tvaerminnensis TaxID=1176355 RepID=A0A4Q9L8P5_9MICR|nr:hypothetical protein CWI37_0239p0040 [Hamiltosporidium tvaerminnensis]